MCDAPVASHPDEDAGDQGNDRRCGKHTGRDDEDLLTLLLAGIRLFADRGGARIQLQGILCLLILIVVQFAFSFMA